MPAITVGFAEFESRLDRIRRRLNAQALFEAGCVVACTIMLAAAATILAESSLALPTAAWVRRVAAAATVFSIAAAAWQLSSGWLDLETTARLVDRRAGMEDRVATLLAHSTSDGRAPLRAILLWQVFNRSAEWEADRVAPLRFRRSAVSTAIALTVLVIAVMRLPDAAGNSDTTVAEAASMDTTSTQMHSVAPARDVSTSTGGGRPSSSEVVGEHTSHDAGSGEGSQHGLPKRGDSRGSTSASEASNAKDDSRTRQPDEADASSHQNTHQNPGGGREQFDNSGLADGSQIPSDAALGRRATPIDHPRKSDQRQRLSSVSGTAPEPAKATPHTTPPTTGDRNDSRPDGGSLARAREGEKGINANARGVLGERGSPAGPRGDKQAESMVIQLRSFAASPVEHYEPQGKAGEATDNPGGDAGTAAPIADEQLEDSLFHRSVVTRAHQDLIRDLFTPPVH